MDIPQHVQKALEIIANPPAVSQESDAPALCLRDYNYEELETILVQGFGEKPYRAKQIFQWLYLHLVDSFDEMTNLSKTLRTKLARVARISPLVAKDNYPSSDGTTKLTFGCSDNAVIETVYIPSDSRNTLCISSQVGCAMGCTFCYTAKMGLMRHLTVGEIVEQVVQARRQMGAVNGHIGNIVFMGMGEPLHNIDNVIRAIHILMDTRGLNFSRRKVTVSTSGLVPAIERLGKETDVQLAISLNATTDATRSKIMPVNDRWNLDTLMACLNDFPLTDRERITFEYVLLKGINDTLDDARRIVELTREIPSKINLIPFNSHPNTPFQAPTEESVEMFQQFLMAQNVACFRRKTRGDEKMAACGQLGKPGDRKEPKHLRTRLEKIREEHQEHIQ